MTDRPPAERLRRFVAKTALGRRLAFGRHRRTLRRWSTTDRALAAFYSPFISAGGLCFDIGANYGNRTKVFLHLGARVIAVEPQPSCCKVLVAEYGSNDRIVVVQAAAGESEGVRDLMIADSHVLSSLSPEWIDSVSRSGRFGATRWCGVERVHLTTIDSLADRYGAPQFVKIDVEGYEPNVLRGMSVLPSGLSFELTLPECLDAALFSIDYLDSLGNPIFNYSMGESMGFVIDEWIDGAALKRILRRQTEPAFGDIFMANSQTE